MIPKPIFATMVAAACVITSACGAQSVSRPTPLQTISQALAIEIWAVEAHRWASAAYYYDFSYRFHNTFTQPVTVTISNVDLEGPDGTSLGGTISGIHPTGPVTVPAGLYSEYRPLIVDDPNIGHPFADTLHMEVSYQPPGGAAGTASIDARVLHGPQTAIIHDFSFSPLKPRVGETVTVRWNVEFARRVVLEAPMLRIRSEEVETIGSRAFGTSSAGTYLNLLKVDGFELFQYVDVASDR